jgi:ABC-2 type transport system permease protein
MPIFLLISFSGAFQAVTAIPGFPTDEIMNWVAPYAVLQGSAFAGVGASQGVASDLENGFYDRLLMSPSPRIGLLLGPLAAAASRVVLPFVLVLGIAFLGGAYLTDGVLGLVMLLVACLGVALVSALWGLSIVYRLRTQRSGALVQVGIFVAMFLSIGQVPLVVMEGWLHTVARVNPMTQVMDLARQGFIGQVSWGETWPGLLVIAAGLVGFGAWAHGGLRRLTA